MLCKGILVCCVVRVYDTSLIHTLQRPAVTGLQLTPISWSGKKVSHQLEAEIYSRKEVSILKKFCSQQTGEEALETDIHQLQFL